MVKPDPPPFRRRTFFSSHITIQPKINVPSSSGARASSNTILAALSPPKDLPASNSKKASKFDQETNNTSGTDALGEAPISSVENDKRGNTHTPTIVRNASTDNIAMKKVSSNSQDGKSLAIGKMKVSPEPPRAQRTAVAGPPPNNDVPGASADEIRPQVTRKYWSSSNPSEHNQGEVPERQDSRIITSARNGNTAAATSDFSTVHGGEAPVMTPRSAAGSSTQRNTRAVNQSIRPTEKRFLRGGFYCQDDHAKAPHKLVSKVLMRREAELKLKSGTPNGNDHYRPAFPPLPYDYGHELFFGEQHDFVLPFNIQTEFENGTLDGKKKPAPYSKLRASELGLAFFVSQGVADSQDVFPERPRVMAAVHAVCRCDSESGCGDNCINRIMSYLCGRDCPCGENCTNKSLVKRNNPKLKISYVRAYTRAQS